MLLQVKQKEVNNYYLDLFCAVANTKTRDGFIRKFKIRGVEWYELNLVRHSLKIWKKIADDFIKSEAHIDKVNELLKSKVPAVNEDGDEVYEIAEEDLKKYHEYVNSVFTRDFMKKIDGDEDILELIELNYAESKIRAEEMIAEKLKKLGCSVEIKKQDIGYDFDAVDERALASLSEGYFYWIGDTYDTALSDRINDIAYGVINSGLGEEDIADAFMSELGDTYTNRSRTYFTIVASNVANNSRSYGSLNTYREYEITEWEYLAILDARTTLICESLDGKIFTVERAIGVIENILRAKSPEDVKSINPFLSWDDERGEPYYETEEETVYIPVNGTPEEIDSFGFLFPPNHILCRSTTVAYFRTEIRNYLPMIEKFSMIGVYISNY